MKAEEQIPEHVTSIPQILSFLISQGLAVVLSDVDGDVFIFHVRDSTRSRYVEIDLPCEILTKDAHEAFRHHAEFALAKLNHNKN